LFFVFSGTAFASNLFVAPTNTVYTEGTNLNISVKINPSGVKTCAAEGTIILDNLSCKSITLSSDVMAQTMPTCSNPYFFIGIPSCTLSEKDIFTVSAIAGKGGPASIKFSAVDLIGEGMSVGSTFVSGSYTINSVPVVEVKPQPVVTPKTNLPSVDKTKSTSNKASVTEVATNTNLLSQTASVLDTDINFNYGWLLSVILGVVGLIVGFIIGRKTTLFKDIF
jgi:hypothetical protein